MPTHKPANTAAASANRKHFNALVPPERLSLGAAFAGAARLKSAAFTKGFGWGRFAAGRISGGAGGETEASRSAPATDSPESAGSPSTSSMISSSITNPGGGGGANLPNGGLGAPLGGNGGRTISSYTISSSCPPPDLPDCGKFLICGRNILLTPEKMSIYSATLYRRKCKYPPRKRRRRGAFRKRSRIAPEAPCRCAGGRKRFRTRGLRTGIPRGPKPMARRRNRDKKTNPFRRFAFIRAGRRTKIGATGPRKELLISMKESTFCGDGSAQ